MCYIQSDVIKYTFLLTDERLSSLAKWVPDILDYSNKNKLIDFSANIDKQLSKFLNLSDKNLKYMQNRWNNLKRNRI